MHLLWLPDLLAAWGGAGVPGVLAVMEDWRGRSFQLERQMLQQKERAERAEKSYREALDRITGLEEELIALEVGRARA
jgi:hypothetical protein